jgi:DNA-binding response OmpR family regulator
VTPSQRILVIEDDLSILTGLSMNLKFEGYEVLQAQDGRTGLQRALDERPDLLILDVMLPQMNGYEVIRELRQRGRDIPVVMLSARGMEQDKILGLDLGADDYVVKPFSVRELLLRVEAVLRRLVEDVSTFSILIAGGIRIDPARHEVTAGGESVILTPLEFRLLQTLLERPGRIQTRETLLSDVWGIDAEIETRTVDTHIKRLRQKLGPSGEFIETIRGIGYRFMEEKSGDGR